ncbi:unannotated protein [freshwater metagenome]
MTSHPREASDLFHGLSETRTVAPWPIETERRHTHHHRSGIHALDGIPIETKSFDDTGREVLDHDVGLRCKLKRERSALRSIKVKGDVIFIGVGRQEEGAVLPPLWAAVEHSASRAHAIDTTC